MPCPDLKTCVLATGEEACSHWMAFQVQERDSLNPSARLREDCALNWLAIFLYDSNVKLLGIQAPVEQTRNVLLDAAQKRRKIGGLQPLQTLRDGSQGNDGERSSGGQETRSLPGNGEDCGGSGGKAEDAQAPAAQESNSF